MKNQNFSNPTEDEPNESYPILPDRMPIGINCDDWEMAMGPAIRRGRPDLVWVFLHVLQAIRIV